MVALAFVVVGASSLVTPVTAAKPAGAGDPKATVPRGLEYAGEREDQIQYYHLQHLN